MRCRNNNARVELVGSCEKCHGRRRHHAHTNERSSYCHDAPHQLTLNHCTRFAGVTSNQYSGVIGLKRVRCRSSDAHNRPVVERVCSGRATYAIRSKQAHGVHRHERRQGIT